MTIYENIASGILDGSFYQTKISTKNHQYVADESLDHGGTDTGPNPFELLASSLISCTAITLKMYADRKGWALGAIRVDVSIDYQRENSRTVFSRDISFSAALEDAQRNRLLQIANACPVHRILSSSIEVQSRLI